MLPRPVARQVGNGLALTKNAEWMFMSKLRRHRSVGQSSIRHI